MCIRDSGQPDEQSWLLMDKLVVGSDGRMRTTSPPNVGVFNRPSDFNLLFNPTNPGLAAIGSTSVLGAVAGLDLFSLHLQSTQSLTNQTAGGQRAVLPIVSAQGAFGDGTADGPKYYAISTPLGDILVPVPATGKDYTIQTRYVEPTGFVTVNSTDVKLLPGGQPVTYSIVQPPQYVVKTFDPATITDMTFDFGSDPAHPSPRLVISGTNFVLNKDPYFGAPSFLGGSVNDLYVTIQVGGRDTFDPKGNVLPVGGSDIVIQGAQLTLLANGTLWAQIPQGAMVAGGYVTVSRKMWAPLNGKWEVQIATSNPAQLVPNNNYSFALNSGDDTVSVIDNTHISQVEVPAPTVADPGNTAFVPQLDPTEIARILLDLPGINAGLNPRNSAITADGTRLYVALNGGAGVAVIDTVALQQIDTDPNTAGVQYIKLRPGSHPFDVVAEPSGRFLYVSDEANAVVYVIDIDPFSKTFNTFVRAIPVYPAPLGLRGLALNSDGSMLFVTAPGQTLFGAYGAPTGSLILIQTNAATRKDPVLFGAQPERRR